MMVKDHTMKQLITTLFIIQLVLMPISESFGNTQLAPMSISKSSISKSLSLNELPFITQDEKTFFKTHSITDILLDEFNLYKDYKDNVLYYHYISQQEANGKELSHDKLFLGKDNKNHYILMRKITLVNKQILWTKAKIENLDFLKELYKNKDPNISIINLVTTIIKDSWLRSIINIFITLIMFPPNAFKAIINNVDVPFLIPLIGMFSIVACTVLTIRDYRKLKHNLPGRTEAAVFLKSLKFNITIFIILPIISYLGSFVRAHFLLFNPFLKLIQIGLFISIFMINKTKSDVLRPQLEKLLQKRATQRERKESKSKVGREILQSLANEYLNVTLLSTDAVTNSTFALNGSA